MKKVIRLAAAVLVALALIASCALAEETASVMIPQGEGSYAEIPAASIQNTAGEKFYWIDMTKLTAEQLAALPGGVLEVFNEEGDLLAEAPFVDTAVGQMPDIPAAVYAGEIPDTPLYVICGRGDAPLTPEEMDAYLASVGFSAAMTEIVEEEPEPTEEPTPEPTEEPTPEPTEEPTPEPTEEPTPEPTEEPTPEPTEEPTPEPTEEPTPEPTEVPTPSPLPQVTPPDFAHPVVDGLELASTGLDVPVVVGADDVLSVFGTQWTEDGTLWYQVQDFRTQQTGWVRAWDVEEMNESAAYAAMDRITEEMATPVPTEVPTPEPTEEPTPEPTEEPTPEPVEELVSEPVARGEEEFNLEEETLAIVPEEEEFLQEEAFTEEVLEEAVPLEVPEYAAPAWDDVPLSDGIGGETQLMLSVRDVLTVQDAVTDGMDAVWYRVRDYRTGKDGYVAAAQLNALDAAEAIAAEERINAEYEQADEQPHTWAVTANQKGDQNNIRGAVDGKVISTVPNGVLVHVGDAQSGKEGNIWYSVSVPENGAQGYMRDYLLSFVSDEEAARILEALGIDEEGRPLPDPEEEDKTETAAEPQERAELLTPEPTAALVEHIEPAAVQEEKPVSQAFPLYALTEEEDGIAIVLRTEPAGSIPNSGAVPTITAQTPVVVNAQASDDAGKLWYLVTVLGDTKTGYIEAEKLNFVSREEAEAAVRTAEATPIPVVETPTAVPTATPEPTAEPTPTPTPTPEPEEPQALTEGSVYHYGKTTAKGVNVRKNPKQSADTRGRLDEGSIIWVKEMLGADPEKAWCAVRTDKGDGYMQAKYIQLMGENEEQRYRATLDDPEVAPEPTAAPTPTPLIELLTPEPSAEVTAEPTETPTPEPTVTPEPTATPLATATPAPVELNVYARVLNNGTPLRGNQDPNAYLQSILPEETVLFVLNSQVAADGMTWYLCQYGDQWGFVRADLVRIMGEQEKNDYLTALQEAQATSTPLALTTPQPYSLKSTSAYVLTNKSNVNLRKTPSGTSLGRLASGTLLLVTDTVKDSSNVEWYEVNYNGKDGYVRSDMVEWLTIGELQDYLEEQAEKAVKAGATPTPNSKNNVSYTITGTQLQDLLPVDGSWSSNTGAALSVTPTPSPEPTASPSPTPVPPANPARLISTNGNLKIYGIPAVTETGTFSVYGTADQFATITATVTYEVQGVGGQKISVIVPVFAAAIAEETAPAANVFTETRGVGNTVAGADGSFVMDIRLPDANREYELAISTGTGASARYIVTKDNGTTPEPTMAPLPTVEPVEEKRGGSLLPILLIVGILVLIAAAAFGFFIYRRREEQEEEEEAGEFEEDESEIRQNQLEESRRRNEQAARESAAGTAAAHAKVLDRAVKIEDEPETQAATPEENIPSYLRTQEGRSPYARPVPPTPPTPPETPVMPETPAEPAKPVVDAEEPGDEAAPRRRRRRTE